MRRRGLDPHELDRATEQLLTFIRTELISGMPVSDRRQGNASRAARNPACPASDRVDRISLLPDVLLRNIVARLPIKDAARTAVLACRWRRVWHSTPLVLSDAHLRPKGRGWPPTPADSPAITAAVSSILAAHAGPLTLVHLTCSHMNKYQAQLARWLRLLAAKDVRELVLVNRPWPLDVPLPAEIFSVTTLTRLYIGLWKFPDVASLPRRTTFPHLRELGICSVVLEDADIDVLVAKSPILEILNIYGSKKGLRLRLVSKTLQCVQICDSVMLNIAVVKAPRLDRLILAGSRSKSMAGGLCTRITIHDAPMLRVFGFLEPGNHILEIRDTIVMVHLLSKLRFSLFN
jgi:hypothetical protein